MRIAAIMRHGEPVYGTGVSIERDRDRRLSELGRRQAQAAREWLQGLDPVCVISSDSPRAIETAQIAGAPREVRIVPGLAGLRLGVWEREPLADAKERILQMLAGEIPPPQGAETAAELGRRATAALREALPPEGNVLVVAHRLTNALLIAEPLGIEPERALRIPQDYAAVSLMSLDDSRDRVLAINVTPLDPLRISRTDVGVL